MVDAEGRAVVEQHRLATPDLRRDVDGAGEVADDLQVRGGVGHQGVVEPDQVLAHQPAGQVVGGPDRLALGADPALVAHPAVATDDRPFVQPDGVGGVVVLVGGGVEGQLSTGVVEDQVVGLLHGVDAATELARLDHVQADRRGWCGGPGLTVRSRTQRPHEPSPTMANSIIGAPGAAQKAPGVWMPCAIDGMDTAIVMLTPAPSSASPLNLRYAVDLVRTSNRGRNDQAAR